MGCQLHINFDKNFYIEASRRSLPVGRRVAHIYMDMEEPRTMEEEEPIEEFEESLLYSTLHELRWKLVAQMQKLQTVFRTWDDDNNGTVSRKEFRQGVALLGVDASQSTIDELFDLVDADHSGFLSYRELGRKLSAPELHGIATGPVPTAAARGRRPLPSRRGSGTARRRFARWRRGALRRTR